MVFQLARTEIGDIMNYDMISWKNLVITWKGFCKTDEDFAKKNACCITIWPLDQNTMLLLPTPTHEPQSHPLWPPTCGSNKTHLNIIQVVITFAIRNNWMTQFILNWRFGEQYTKLLLLSCLQNSMWSHVRHRLFKAKLRQGRIS